jgi:hypothetical protein
MKIMERKSLKGCSDSFAGGTDLEGCCLDGLKWHDIHTSWQDIRTNCHEDYFGCSSYILRFGHKLEGCIFGIIDGVIYET